MPRSQRPGWIDWIKSETRCIIIEDLARGILPLNNNELTAEQAWEVCYKHMAEVVQEGVVFSQFKARLAGHRAQARKDEQRSVEEEEMLLHDRQLYPRQFTTPDGLPVFDLHPARDLLRKDVEMNLDKVIDPSALWTTRKEYQDFDKNYFRRRIYQTRRRQKFINYLNHKRQVKKQVVSVKPPINEYY